MQEHYQLKQGNMAPSKPNSPRTASLRHPNTPEKQDPDVKSHDVDRRLQEVHKYLP